MIKSNDSLCLGTILFVIGFQRGHRTEAKVHRCESSILYDSFFRENLSLLLFSELFPFVLCVAVDRPVRLYRSCYTISIKFNSDILPSNAVYCFRIRSQ